MSFKILHKKKLVILLISSLFLLTPSCFSKRKAIKEPVKDEGAAYLFGRMKENEFKYEYLSGKFQAKLNSTKRNNSFSGSIRLQRDSAIWVSISPALGIELLRLLITPDSVFILNRIEKSYFKGSFEIINEMMNTALDFDMMQSAITGNDLSYYERDVFKADVDGKYYRLSTIGRAKIKKYIKNENQLSLVLSHDIWLDTESFRIIKMMIKVHQKDNRKVDVIYGNHIKVEQSLFPAEQYYKISAENITELTLQFERIQSEIELAFPFSIPSSYILMKFE